MHAFTRETIVRVRWVALALIMLLGLSTVIRHAAFSAPRRVLAIDSPDRRFQMIVEENRPAWPMQSPYRYQLFVADAATRQALPGKPLWIDTDSAPMDDTAWNPNWAADSKSGRIGDAEFVVENGEQDWRSTAVAKGP